MKPMMTIDDELIPTRYQIEREYLAMKIDAVTIDRCNSPDYKGDRWAVRRTGACLATDGEWEYEPMPSNRSAKFYERCRFKSLDEAIKILQQTQ
jgi:hypothetical protein